MPRCITCQCYRSSARSAALQPHHQCLRSPSPIDGLPMTLDADAERRLTGAGNCGPAAQFWEKKPAPANQAPA